LGVAIVGHDAASHVGGDKLFVDYAGDMVPVIVDWLTGQVRPAQIFVAVMGASNFTYAEASWTQALADWIAPIPVPSQRSAACPNCWCGTFPRKSGYRVTHIWPLPAVG
jgi:hypothetical protein